MTEQERQAMIEYYQEHRRHLLAQAAACQRIIASLEREPCYNKPGPSEFKTQDIAGVIE